MSSLLRLPPRWERTKTHSMPSDRQLEHLWRRTSVGSSPGCGGSSPSHFIFFSRHARHACLATGLLSVGMSGVVAENFVVV